MSRGSTVLSARVERPQVAGTAPARRGWARRAADQLLAQVRAGCALAGLALLGCVVLVGLGTLGSLAWMLVAER